MSTTFLGNALIAELLADPVAFKERGRAYQLLEEYFAGLPVETLRPLLNHENTYVRHAAVWVTEELGQQASSLLDDAIPLITSEDRFLSYHGLEIAIACAVGKYADRFLHVALALDSADDVIRALAMRLATRADVAQLQAAARAAESNSKVNDVHRRGLSLLASCELRGAEDVRQMLLQSDAVARMYGAIAAKRLRRNQPELLQLAAGLSDPNISRFANEAA